MKVTIAAPLAANTKANPIAKKIFLIFAPNQQPGLHPAIAGLGATVSTIMVPVANTSASAVRAMIFFMCLRSNQQLEPLHPAISG
jgi:hypothetical protein